MKQGFTKIWIIVILIALTAGGILVWQYFGAPKEKVKVPEEKEEIVTPEEEKLVITSEEKMKGRDIARISDLLPLRTALELYYSDYKKYPGEPGSNQWEVIIEIFSFYNLGAVPQERKERHPSYEYWVSNDGQKYILKVVMETHYWGLESDIDGWPMGEGKVYCGTQGVMEREYCEGKGFKVTPPEPSPETILREDEPAKKSRDAIRKADIGQIRNALENYYMDQYPGQYPGNAGSNQWNILESVLVPKYLDYLLNEQKPGHPSYEYWVSSDNQKYILKAILEIHDSSLEKDIDGYPLGMGLVYCGTQGPNEREFCVGEMTF